MRPRIPGGQARRDQGTLSIVWGCIRVCEVGGNAEGPSPSPVHPLDLGVGRSPQPQPAVPMHCNKASQGP